MFLFYLDSATSKERKKKKNLLQVAVSMGACIIDFWNFFISDFILHNLKCLLYYFYNAGKCLLKII